MERKQTTSRVLMIRPANFGFNTETAANNHFQRASDTSAMQISKAAKNEFDNFVSLLRGHGIDVWVIQDSPTPWTPDSIFPNNLFSTHITGELILYPMFAQNRQLERKLTTLATVGQFEGVQRVINLSGYERENQYLEGTGSMVLDRVNKIVYCCASERSSRKVLDEYCNELGYTSHYFSASDLNGNPIYHTNVMMCVGDKYTVICLECIKDEKERTEVIESFKQTGHEIIDISLEQVYKFAGNMLQLENEDGEKFLIMSAQAKSSLNEKQMSTILKYNQILSPEIYTIEENGGGSARCMIAEIFC
ncbi:citrulline utilization hydrolase CtlX [Porphyromonas pogonae]|uniref:citrulline utilization hydrolase CtlX n=1 Tax=Porphyromonas pogonae TaxID=867595 RepID=UPI002E78A304|nr:arginine deiminase-related protein [Porphyromonas pogonae]